MKRKAVIIRKSENGKRCIAVDIANFNKIIAYLKKDKRHINKFEDICNLILNGLRNPQLYDKEEPDKHSKGVRAMKFFKGQENDRIYCKETNIECNTFVVVTAELHDRKKSEGLSHKELSLIHKVAKYEYEIEYPREDKESV